MTSDIIACTALQIYIIKITQAVCSLTGQLPAVVYCDFVIQLGQSAAWLARWWCGRDLSALWYTVYMKVIRCTDIRL